MRGIKQYKDAKVQSAPKHQIVLMLYQEIIQRLMMADALIEDEPSRTWLPHIHHARTVFLELLSALDRSIAPDLCDQLHALYRWCISELIAVGRDADRTHIDNVQKVTTTLLEGWQEAIKKQGAAA